MLQGFSKAELGCHIQTLFSLWNHPCGRPWRKLRGKNRRRNGKIGGGQDFCKRKRAGILLSFYHPFNHHFSIILSSICVVINRLLSKISVLVEDGVGRRWSSRSPSNPTHSMILWRCSLLFILNDTTENPTSESLFEKGICCFFRTGTKEGDLFIIFSWIDIKFKLKFSVPSVKLKREKYFFPFL